MWGRKKPKGIRSRYWGPFKQEWYSICSAHQGFDPSCPRCQAGHWRSVVVQAIDSTVHRFAYPVWFWWHNRPNSASRKRLKGFFPNLK
jgi:hypothetical protein